MVTIYTTVRSCAPYPAYSDTHMSPPVWGMLEHYVEELAAGRLVEVRVVSDGKGIEDSRRAMDEEARAADASEATLRAMGG